MSAVKGHLSQTVYCVNVLIVVVIKYTGIGAISKSQYVKSMPNNTFKSATLDANNKKTNLDSTDYNLDS